MSAPKFFFPTNRLALALRAASPRSAAECLKAATANVAAMADECLEAVDVRLDSLNAAFASSGSEPSQPALQEIYDLAAQLIGVAAPAGLPDLGTAAASLCDVVDGMLTRDEARAEPIRVHISAMHLLRSAADAGAATAPILEGLAKVRRRFRAET